MLNLEQQMAADCMAQHIRAFRGQFLRGEQADFGAPCSECLYNRRCSYEWLNVMQPILKNSNIEISMALTEQR